jgi:hypothetical protein
MAEASALYFLNVRGDGLYVFFKEIIKFENIIHLPYFFENTFIYWIYEHGRELFIFHVSSMHLEIVISTNDGR